MSQLACPHSPAPLAGHSSAWHLPQATCPARRPLSLGTPGTLSPGSPPPVGAPRASCVLAARTPVGRTGTPRLSAQTPTRDRGRGWVGVPYICTRCCVHRGLCWDGMGCPDRERERRFQMQWRGPGTGTPDVRQMGGVWGCQVSPELKVGSTPLPASRNLFLNPSIPHRPRQGARTGPPPHPTPSAGAGGCWGRAPQGTRAKGRLQLPSSLTPP